MSEKSNPEERIVLNWCGLTDVGRFRKNNEDAFLALSFDAREVRYLGKIGEAQMSDCDFIFAVSDGMGGARSGEYASRIAVDKITELLPKSFHLGALGLNQGCNQIIGELLDRIHAAMLEMGARYEECRGMGATLSLCWFTPGLVHFGHVGDSRIYYMSGDDPIRQVTEDHTHVGALVRQGKITDYEAKNRPDRNVLDQALGGMARKIDPQIGSVAYQKGDRFILCTDGVTNGISDRRIQSLIEFPPSKWADANAAERLVFDAKEESGRDNLTALVVEIT